MALTDLRTLPKSTPQWVRSLLGTARSIQPTLLALAILGKVAGKILTGVADVMEQVAASVAIVAVTDAADPETVPDSTSVESK